MRVAILIAFAAVAAGCGSKEAIPAESPTNEQPPSGNDPNRRLTKAECVQLGQSVVDSCRSRGNDRSAEVDGWCSDMVRRNTESDAWVNEECLPHFRYMDSFCFGSANNAHGMLDCDKTVDRTR